MRRTNDKVLLAMDTLLKPTQELDAYAWRAALLQLEKDWLAPLLHALRAGQLQRLTLVGLGDEARFAVSVTPGDRLRFWRKPLPLAVGHRLPPSWPSWRSGTVTRIVTRRIPTRASLMLEQSGLHPLLARLYAARGIVASDELDTSLASLLPPDQLLGAHDAAVLLADAIAAGKKLLIVADYDCDGATACAVGLRALRSMIGRW